MARHLWLGAIASSLLLSAHTVNIDRQAGVAGTWHIEPDHNPRANQPTRVWVALTTRGGKQIPMNSLQCRMAVFNLPRRSGDAPLQRYPVKPVNAERWSDIPGADVVFPKAGRYQLQLKCTSTAQLSPFQLTYDTTVR